MQLWPGTGVSLFGRLPRQGHEESPVAPDVVLLGVFGFQPELYQNAVGSGPVVVVEVFGGLDVLLIAVSPVKIDLLSVVGNRVPLIAGVSSPRDEVAVLVVSAEEGVQVIVDVDLDGLPATSRLRSFLGFQIPQA